MVDRTTEAAHVKHLANYKKTEVPAPVGVLYRGVVIDNIDPEQLGRVKLSIENVTASTSSKDDAKWAWTLNVFGGGQEGGQRYGATYPYPVGCKVWVLFEQSDQKFNNPVVIGGWYQKARIPLQTFDRRKKNVPNAWGWVSPKGHSVYTRDEKDEESIELISKGGRKIVISDKKDHELISLIGKKGGEIILKEGSEGTVITLMDPKGQCITIDEKAKSINIQANETLNMMAKHVNIVAGDQLSTMSADTIIAASGSVTMAGIQKTQVGNIISPVNIDGSTVTTTAVQIKDLATAISMVAAATISETATARISLTSGAQVSVMSGGNVSITATTTTITSGLILLNGQVISKG